MEPGTSSARLAKTLAERREIYDCEHKNMRVYVAPVTDFRTQFANTNWNRLAFLWYCTECSAVCDEQDIKTEQAKLVAQDSRKRRWIEHAPPYQSIRHWDDQSSPNCLGCKADNDASMRQAIKGSIGCNHANASWRDVMADTNIQKLICDDCGDTMSERNKYG